MCLKLTMSIQPIRMCKTNFFYELQRFIYKTSNVGLRWFIIVSSLLLNIEFNFEIGSKFENC